MNSIAIITARSGSKRIPKKNIKNFCGRPIIAYSIRAALDSKIFDEVMVSTDSEEIAKIAIEFEAKVPFLRSEKTSDDYATTSDVLEEVIERYNLMGMSFDTICCIYPTAPFVTAQKLRDAMYIFKDKNAACVTPVVKFGFPPQRAFVLKDGKVEFQYPEFAKARSQDLDPIFHDCGQFYILKTVELLKHHTITPPNTYPFIMSEEEVQDIDNISDWKLAESKFKNLYGI